MTCSKLDDSAINGSGYAAITVRLERGADIGYTVKRRQIQLQTPSFSRVGPSK